MKMKSKSESLKFVRFLMVLSSFNILFLLWLVNGVNALDNCFFEIKGIKIYLLLIFRIICFFLIMIPSLMLFFREKTAIKDKEFRIIKTGKAEDHRDHLLVYLLAVLLPLWTANMESISGFITTVIAFLFIIFLFYNLNLHYINAIYAIRGYKIYTVIPPLSENVFSGKRSFVIPSKRDFLPENKELKLLRLSDNVYIEIED
jgi:hypothetical protein